MDFLSSDHKFEAYPGVFEVMQGTHEASAVLLLDVSTAEVVVANEHASFLLGYSMRQIHSLSVYDFQSEIERLDQWMVFVEKVRSNGCLAFTGNLYRKDQKRVSARFHASGLFFSGYDCIVFYIENHGKAASWRMWACFDALGDGCRFWAVDDGVVQLSSKLAVLLGRSAQQSTLIPFSEWLSYVDSRDRRRFIEYTKKLVSDGAWDLVLDYRLQTKELGAVWLRDRAWVSERNDIGQVANVIFLSTNVTQDKERECYLMDLASRDELTGLMNRREGDELLSKQLKYCERQHLSLGVCLLDIDRFKQFNDSYGHLSGDKVLKKVATLVEQRVRASDYLYRWGGEEFVLLCPGSDLANLQAIAEKVRRAIASYPWHQTFSEAEVTASIGLAVFPLHAGNEFDLLQEADKALYQAKNNGRNCVVSATAY